VIKELVMIRDGVCCLSSDEFVKDDASALISFCQPSDFILCFLFISILYSLYRILYLLCTSCTI